MRRYWLLIAPAILTAAFAASAANLDFEANFRMAIDAGATEEGAAYDRALERYFFALPELTSGIVRCVEASSSTPRVRGYFYFGATGSYRLFLKPESAFSECLETVFDGKSPPTPPKRPYLNPFTLGIDPLKSVSSQALRAHADR